MVRLLTLKRLFSKVDLASLEHIEASYSGLGPRHYPVGACFFALVLMHLLNMSSETVLAGLNRFKRRVGVEGFERLFEELTFA